MKKTLLALVALAAAIAVAPMAGAAVDRKGPPAAKTAEIQILGLNDFHGALEPPSGSGGRIGSTNAGGVEYLATHVRALRAENPNTLFVSAGDLIGATPLISALFHDEPSIEAFNLMDLDYNGVGNHEFDEGVDELLRMQNGGCHPVDGCVDGDPFNGATFDFLAANVKYKDTGETIFPPYDIHEFANGVKVGIIGMTLEGTPNIVTPAGIQSVNFLDEADTVNALVPVLQKQGVKTIIVLLHEGGSVDADRNGAGIGGETAMNDCANPTGALPPIVERMDDAIDVVVTGHTNWAVNCVIDGKVVTGAASSGRLVTDIDLTINLASQNVIPSLTRVNNKIVTRDVAKAPDLTALVDKYAALVAPLANRVVGQASADLLRANNDAGESSLGDVIADAQHAATKDPLFGGAVVAFMNPGGIRGDIAAGDVTYGELFTVQPFSNVMTVLTCTGAQIDQLLEEQFQHAETGAARQTVLQVSDGFTYTWDASAPLGDKVDIASIQIDGTPISALASYRVAMNNFLATGGDVFPTFTACTDSLGGEIDLDALVRYFETSSPIGPGPQNRITLIP
jgi:5'-nucleotidase